MNQHNAQNVLTAFDVLIEEMEDALRSIHKGGADALETGNYERAQTAIEHARRVMFLYEKIAALKGEWKDVEGTFSVHEDPEQQTSHAASVQRQTRCPLPKQNHIQLFIMNYPHLLVDSSLEEFAKGFARQNLPFSVRFYKHSVI